MRHARASEFHLDAHRRSVRGFGFMPNALQQSQKVFRFVQQRGVRHAGRRAMLVARDGWMTMVDRRREAPFGVNTGGAVELTDLAIKSENRSLGFAYVPSPGLLVATLVSSLSEDLSRFAFVDYGSGKGRALLVAAHYPFAQVVGAEFSPELHAMAEANIAGYLRAERPARSVRSVCADAATFDLPEQDLVLYFNNPFAGPVFDQVLKNIQAAHERSGRKVYVLYQQLASGLEQDPTDNLATLQRCEFLRERAVRYPSRVAGFLLGSYDLRVFESVKDASRPVG